ncbi:hypothetical protein G7047_29430 [Diaphorobacter sp. HDW4A]|uniref:hypothetical protein n=1 Tax=Diaphorobacter sp. HDW4A TaxID=2714924 RepID=UPI00140AB66C|nr:hypothetical protein [Diaphorobacter sp. HDW4A]QIL83599.1 hypothetical protein G7047_29430 [Diaphorobacter sp. HDW4A]
MTMDVRRRQHPCRADSGPTHALPAITGDMATIEPAAMATAALRTIPAPPLMPCAAPSLT